MCVLNGVRQIEIHSAKRLRPEQSAFDVEMATGRGRGRERKRERERESRLETIISKFLFTVI